MYFGTYGQCGVSAPLIRAMSPNKVPSDRFGYYGLSFSQSVSCNNQGYIYYVGSGLRLTQPKYSNTISAWEFGADETAGSYRSTTLHPRDVSIPSKTVAEQALCFVKGMNMSAQSGITYDCFGVLGDEGGDEWYNFETQGNGVKLAGSSHDSTFVTAVSRGGEWCFLIKNKT